MIKILSENGLKPFERENETGKRHGLNIKIKFKIEVEENKANIMNFWLF